MLAQTPVPQEIPQPNPVQPASPLGRLVLKQVPAIGFLAHDLAGTGLPEPLRRPTVGLGLGHVSSVFLVLLGSSGPGWFSLVVSKRSAAARDTAFEMPNAVWNTSPLELGSSWS